MMEETRQPERAGVVIIKKKKILLMQRIKRGQEYYIIPGGGLESGESPEEAALRESQEELSLVPQLKHKLWEYIEADGRKHHYFMASIGKNNPVLGGEEKDMSSPDNYFGLQWISIEALPDIEMKSPKIKQKLIKFLIE